MMDDWGRVTFTPRTPVWPRGGPPLSALKIAQEMWAVLDDRFGSSRIEREPCPVVEVTFPHAKPVGLITITWGDRVCEAAPSAAERTYSLDEFSSRWIQPLVGVMVAQLSPPVNEVR